MLGGMLLPLLPPSPPSLGDDVTGSAQLEHPHHRRGGSRAILTAPERREAAEPVRAEHHGGDLSPPWPSFMEGCGW